MMENGLLFGDKKMIGALKKRTESFEFIVAIMGETCYSMFHENGFTNKNVYHGRVRLNTFRE